MMPDKYGMSGVSETPLYSKMQIILYATSSNINM